VVRRRPGQKRLRRPVVCGIGEQQAGLVERQLWARSRRFPPSATAALIPRSDREREVADVADGSKSAARPYARRCPFPALCRLARVRRRPAGYIALAEVAALRPVPATQAGRAARSKRTPGDVRGRMISPRLRQRLTNWISWSRPTPLLRISLARSASRHLSCCRSRQTGAGCAKVRPARGIAVFGCSVSGRRWTSVIEAVVKSVEGFA
jgi:hypothetical protein